MQKSLKITLLLTVSTDLLEEISHDMNSIDKLIMLLLENDFDEEFITPNITSPFLVDDIYLVPIKG